VDVRLKRLAWERERFLLRTALAPTRDPAAGAAVAHDEPPTARPLHEISQPASPFEPANDPPVESEAERRNRELLEAYEFATLVREAGRNAGSRLAGVRVEPEPPRRLGGLRLPSR
jgi:hypothetical protein